jgi:nucleotide-binding universal stress UspA family protein
MLPFKRILCPTDFSEPAEAAFEAAAELTQQFESELFFVHVVGSVPVTPTPASTTFNVPGYQQELVNSAKESLDRLVDTMEKEKVRVRPVVRQGEAADEIIAFAEEEKVDLIVIATHGRTGWRRFMFGSVAEKVVRLASCPVLTIGPGPKAGE